MNIPFAIISLIPDAKFEFRDGVLTWLDTENTQPTDIEIEQEIAKLKYQDEIEQYKQKRASEYPSIADQLDDIYHNGIDAWKSNIQSIKNKYPKETMDADELQTRQDAAVFALQLKKYTEAMERLSQYQVALGREETTREVSFEGETSTIVVPAIEPVDATVEVINLDGTTSSIENPLITTDNEERAAAQAIIDATPQEVIDAYNEA